jgi:hypothetical protein
VQCQGPLWAAYNNYRTVTTLTGVYHLTLRIRRCINPTCPRYHQPYRPEEEGAWALPHGEFGLDVIALIGALRYRDHRSVPEIHQQLLIRNIQLAERTVTYLLQRYEELLTLRLTDQTRLRACLAAQGQVLLALDGLQPDRGHEVLWVIRDCLSGEVLLARSLLSSTQGDLVGLLREVKQALEVPVCGIISDGQETIRTAVQAVFPTVPHQLCQFHENAGSGPADLRGRSPRQNDVAETCAWRAPTRTGVGRSRGCGSGGDPWLLSGGTECDYRRRTTAAERSGSAPARPTARHRGIDRSG